MTRRLAVVERLRRGPCRRPGSWIEPYGTVRSYATAVRPVLDGILTLVSLEEHGRRSWTRCWRAIPRARGRRSSRRSRTASRSRTSISGCSTRRCARSGTAGRWARSTSPRSTTRPRSPSRSSTASAASCGGRRRTGGWRSSPARPRSCTRSARAMVADFLEADGWEVILLGAGAPRDDIAPLVESEQPDVVALSTATAGVLDGVVEVLARCARWSRGRASSPAASSGRPRRARARSSSAPTSSSRTRASSSRCCTSRSRRWRRMRSARAGRGRGGGAGAVRRGGRVARGARADRAVGLEPFSEIEARVAPAPNGRRAAGCGSPSATRRSARW